MFTEADIIRTKRGARMLKLSGFTFRVHKMNRNKSTRWWCSRYMATGCKAYVVTIDDEIVKSVNEHCHPPCLK